MNIADGRIVSRRAARLGSLLRATDVAVPPIAYPEARIARASRRRLVVRWSEVAAVLLLAGAALGVAPVRAWIVGAARIVWAVASGRQQVGTRAPAAAPAPSSVSFTPAGHLFTVRIASHQSGGQLRLETTAGSAASAATTAGEGATLVVVPDGLRIENVPEATGNIVVRVPAATTRVAVSIGTAAPRVFVPASAGQRWILDLRAGP